MQTQKEAYENAKRERENLFALIAEKEHQIELLRKQEEEVVLAYQKAQADKGMMSHAMFEGDRMKEEIERLRQKEETEKLIELRKEEIEREEKAIEEEDRKITEKSARYTECIRKKEHLTEIYHEGTALERQERELKEELRAAELQLVKMQSVEKLRLHYEELTAEYARLMADKEMESEELEAAMEKVKKEAFSEKMTMELLLEQMGIHVIPGNRLPSVEQFTERRDVLKAALDEVLEKIDVLVKEQEECLVAREQAEKLAKEIDKEQEMLAIRAEKCQRIKTELRKQQQYVQGVILDAAFESLQEAEEAMERFVREQEEKREFISRAEQEYEQWKLTFENETALLDQLYGQRLIQMQKEQLAMEEYKGGLHDYS